MTSKLLPVLVASACTFIAADAAAHIDLMEPLSRSNNDAMAQKTGPCEGVGPGDRAELTAGDPLNVVWKETVQHPGHFRIAINQDGDDFDAPGTQADFDGIMGGNIILVETEDDTDGEDYSHTLTVPNVNCDNCTLQLVQLMTTDDPVVDDDLYFRCADIKISGATGDGGAGGGSGSSAGGSGSGEGGSSSNGTASNGSGGASSAAGGAGSGSASGGAAPAAPTADSGEVHDCAVRAVGASDPTSGLAMAMGLGAMVSLAAARRRRRG